MRKTNATAPIHETKLPSRLIRAWQDTVIQTARLKGVERDSTDKAKLEQIIRQEHHNVRQLWEAFTTEREMLPRYLLDPKKQTTAYLLGFHLPNAARVWNLFSRLHQRYDFQELMHNHHAINLCDLGCGTGSMGHAVTAFLGLKHPAKTVEVGLIDQQGPFLDAARLGYKNLEFTSQIKSKKGSLEQSLTMLAKNLPNNKLNIILLGYVWNELSRNPKAQRSMLELLAQQTPKDTMIVILEPANQYISRAAMELRDQLVSLDYQSLYPCIHSSPCPMLLRPKDWCYSETSWDLPVALKKLDRSININRERLRYTGHVLASPSVTAKLRQRFPKGAYPIVGLPTMKGRESHHFEYLICQKDKLEKYPRTITAKRTLQRGALLFTNPLTTKKT